MICHNHVSPEGVEMSVFVDQRSLDQFSNVGLFEPKRTRLCLIQDRIYLGKESLVLDESLVDSPAASY